jgi:hypothetical protein
MYLYLWCRRGHLTLNLLTLFLSNETWGTPLLSKKEEEEAIPAHHTKTSWVAYQLASEYQSSTSFERYATGKASIVKVWFMWRC